MIRLTLAARRATPGLAPPSPGVRARLRVRASATLLAVMLGVVACGPGATAPELPEADDRQNVEAPPLSDDGDVAAQAPSATRSARLGDLPVTDAIAPISVRIPAIDVRAPVEPTGTDGGAFDVLDGVDAVGWYRYGPAPGEAGSAVLAAHVDTAREGRGVFFELAGLTAGERIEVVRDDGEQLAFEVVSVDRYGKTQLPVDELFARTGRSRLTLITCGGAFDPALGRYEDNVVVIAAPV